MVLHGLKIIGLIILGFTLAIYIFLYLTNTYIKAEFKDLDPLPARMGVYYKGFRIGTSSKVRISKDFETTFLYITLNQRGLELPKNITAEIKNYDEDTRYVDLKYPEAPMLKYITTGDIIQGKSTYSLSGISNINQTHLDNLSEKGEGFLSSATNATDSLTNLFDLIYQILDENRQNLYASSTSLKNSMLNLENSTNNLKDITSKINKELTPSIIKNSASNIEITTSNLANSSKEFVTISGNFNKSSNEFNVLIPKLSTLIDTAQKIGCNISDIVTGIKSTLQKRLGGARIIFGQPVK